ncbi:MAG: hypothetical protein HYT21_01155 [Candidatus Nealsonbacteria bacterium]|nr:hypothetical protein [Candidatus Nealsonbacteria bacterium]
MRSILFLYLEWHFVDRPKVILEGWLNCLKFNLNYWSVPVLLKTYFSHWRRYRYSYGRGFNFSRYIEAFAFNMISRAVGAVMRTIFIFLGIAAEILILAIGIFAILFWLVLPGLLFLGLFYGFQIIF